MNDTTELDLTAMSDPDFLTLRHDVHVKISTAPDDDQGDLRAEYARVEREFARRCGYGWALP